MIHVAMRSRNWMISKTMNMKRFRPIIAAP
jgi:hypothetical protein